MGYYIEAPLQYVRAKAEYLLNAKGAQKITQPDSVEHHEAVGKAVIGVVSNGLFDAAAYIYNDRELQAFTDPSDSRPKVWLLMDRDEAVALSGFRDFRT